MCHELEEKKAVFSNFSRQGCQQTVSGWPQFVFTEIKVNLFNPMQQKAVKGLLPIQTREGTHRKSTKQKKTENHIFRFFLS
jgi:hypothetical protein